MYDIRSLVACVQQFSHSPAGGGGGGGPTVVRYLGWCRTSSTAWVNKVYVIKIKLYFDIKC